MTTSTAVLVNPLTLDEMPQQNAGGGTTSRAQAGRLVQCQTTAGAVIVQAPANPAEGNVFGVNDDDGAAAAHNITVQGAGKLIDGAATLVLATNGALAFFMFDRGQWRRTSPRRKLDGAVVQQTADGPSLPSSLVTTVGATAPITSSGGTSPVIGITAAVGGGSPAAGSMSGADKVKLDNLQKQGPTTTPGAFDIDWSLSGTYSKQLVAAQPNAITFSNVADGKLIVVKIDGNAAASLAWPAGIKWPGGVAPTQTANGVDVYTFVAFGAVVYGTFAQDMK